ncbi:PAS domain S-box-containing protein/diguanylate cyclase (GGDEF) domain-containing protein [Duganella sp. CF517]|uniref:putative bifunctional diguanylate cyclase/phosphodiesterase n=1 Tax=Duganella sp. CF517 TaxID=1881038 RepID=UPI0008C53790|nr:EAL domain-containing protein [Duganella sp. CF517]SEN82105.1 PAS domain S-box-containing protein/diguanylate cyclase (GGDEF) domain-containing protein [Duganella sp. CF517]
MRVAGLSFVLFGCAAYAAWTTLERSVETITAFAYGLTFLWVGWRLAGKRNQYRLLGLILVARGVFNLANGMDLVPTAFEVWFIWSFVIKASSMLCLIHAVQEKIQKRYTRAIDSLSKGFLVYDRNGRIRSANESCARLLGAPGVKQLLGTRIVDWLPSVGRRGVAAHFQRFADAARYPHVETVVVDVGGRALPLELIASPHYERGQLHCMMLVMDITERKNNDDLLQRAANFDSVTGLLNRHGLSGRLAAALAQARAEGSGCAVLFVDIDKFKRVNDSFGHGAGDQLLIQMAQLLRGMARDGDLLARFGGDEFIVVLQDLPLADVAAAATARGQQILRALNNGFQLSPQLITVSASIGVACYPGDGGDADALTRNADIAMHDVKKSGRGELRFFDPAMSAYARDALVIDGALRGAIQAGELSLVYQPIVDAASGGMDKAEALLRWHSASLGAIGPDRFIPVAEDSGLIIELGAWVLDEACRQLAGWRDSLPQLVVSINVSARQLLDPAFIGLVERALSANGLAPGRLELELTERVLISDGAQVRDALGRLRALGVSLSLDDFGTGYSSLSYLTQFQINTLKIDRAFVTDMVDSPRSNALVATIIAMGKSLGLQLVAEGVETAGQARALEAMGCHYLQGYHISRPVGAAALPLFARRDGAATVTAAAPAVLL